MRSRRHKERRVLARILGAATGFACRIRARAASRPVDTCAILAAGSASLVIVVNAMFLQSGVHPAPFFANPGTSQVAAGSRAKPVEPSALPRPAPAPLSLQPVAVRRNDPIADLIGPSPRIIAVQRVLSDFGYGQIKPSGLLDEATSAAIEKFEREHKLPVTGRVTDRLVDSLTTLAGHPLQ